MIMIARPLIKAMEIRSQAEIRQHSTTEIIHNL